ncbi:hypothetical protein OG285_35920 (plasmid) [Streptomyces sp. NBC_01471]|uniref:hypothetical protein n=1 Tax=Streptomyces sp. NBC_01471 TaxID=2903879 RepID=UPI0032508FC7
MIHTVSETLAYTRSGVEFTVGFVFCPVAGLSAMGFFVYRQEPAMNIRRTASLLGAVAVVLGCALITAPTASADPIGVPVAGGFLDSVIGIVTGTLYGILGAAGAL